MSLSRYTVADCRKRFSDLVTPGDPTNPDFLDALNEVTERLLQSAVWKDVAATIFLTVNTSEDTISLPPEFESILQVQVNDVTYPVFNASYEFINMGMAYLNKSLCTPLVDLGDSFGTFVDVPAEPATLQLLAADVLDTTVPIRIYGLDENGEIIYDEFGNPGEERLPGFGTPTTTSSIFSRVTGFRKGLTRSTLTLSHTSPTTMDVTELQVYLPWMTDPTFRRYSLSTGNTPVVKARCRLRHNLLQMEDQYVLPGNLGAIKNGLMALGYEDANDLERSEVYWAKAEASLDNQLGSSRGGGQSQPNINLWGTGVHPLRSDI